MKSSTSEAAGRRSGSRGSRRRRGGRGSRGSSSSPSQHQNKPAKSLSLWQKIVGFLSGKPASKSQGRPAQQRTTVVQTSGAAARAETPQRPSRKAEALEVSSPKLYVGNLSYDATESDLFELFKGVGTVRNAEIVTHKHTIKSKGFGFVTMSSVEEAKRAVDILHDQEFMGRKLFVSGSKSSPERDSRSGTDEGPQEPAAEPREAA